MEEDHKTRLRIFCAVELPEDVREEAARYVARLRERFPNVRASWERREKLHLTLKFLGEIERGRVEDLERATARAAASVSSFDISITGTGAFPPRGVARVLWLGVRDEAGRLSILQRRLEDACFREGFERDERPFRPHLTIARIRTPVGASDLGAFHQNLGFDAGPFGVSEITVVRSELSPSGSHYAPLSRHRLGVS